jgi:hypothetical protein
MAEDAKMLRSPLFNPMPPGQNASNGQTPGMGVSPMSPTGIPPVEPAETRDQHGRDGRATHGQDARATGNAGFHTRSDKKRRNLSGRAEIYCEEPAEEPAVRSTKPQAPNNKQGPNTKKPSSKRPWARATGYRLPATLFLLRVPGSRFQVPGSAFPGHRPLATGYRLPATGY